MRVLVATDTAVVSFEPERGATGSISVSEPRGHRPTCLTAAARASRHEQSPRAAGRVWCGTNGGGVLRSDDGGQSWQPSGLGLEGTHVMSLAASPSQADLVWAGTEPSAVYRSDDAGETWEPCPGLDELPSSSTWAFPPRPETHHVRWITCHPSDPGRLWVAIEAGALISTPDGGVTWRDRVEGGPYDTHELAVHPLRPETLRAAAGDGYFESEDGGATWSSPSEGLEVDYLRSVAIDPGDPEVVVVSAASRPRSAYAAGRSDGRLYRREGDGPWERVRDGWPDPPSTIAPLLIPGSASGELWAADERGVHRSGDGGRSWERVAGFPRAPFYLRGLALDAIRG